MLNFMLDSSIYSASHVQKIFGISQTRKIHSIINEHSHADLLWSANFALESGPSLSKIDNFYVISKIDWNQRKHGIFNIMHVV